MTPKPPVPPAPRPTSPRHTGDVRSIPKTPPPPVRPIPAPLTPMPKPMPIVGRPKTSVPVPVTPPPNTVPKANAIPMAPSSAGGNFAMKRGGYVTKDGRLNLGSGRVSTTTKSKKNPNF